ncbi:FAD-dependent oxidoreductase [Microcoleus sp. FACHB-68]|uniref:NAD(P)/FAD-dependent oxidoreductase n=1 Tax=Microcoleus sp. FACHB-68 TaxID=2692826 RepID=UPI001688C1F2|nr:FAD-dependent oxidoreductase [Microcoleus sp. FACHB-68]MBD1940054.1 FAD-binding oxidoreductase [Microcoleus sp. FACHB-68]
MSHVAVIGCGVVGAMIAYELSRLEGLKITVLDRQPPAEAATGAALGVLMGAISQKVKGRAWQMRLASLQRYETLIPELERLTGRQIPYNRQGILMLCFADEEMAKWQILADIRRSQGLALKILDKAAVKSNFPQLGCQQLAGAIYSPQDRQVDPVALTQALVDAARRNGVIFKFGVAAEEFNRATNPDAQQVCRHIYTTAGSMPVDWVVLAAGLGSTQLSSALKQPVEIKPVLGQALHLRLRHPLGRRDLQPVITGDDVHIVPCGAGSQAAGDYWVGATVEFSENGNEPVADATQLEAVLQQAIALCPALAEAAVIRKWSGLRPRPEGRPAPVIGHLTGYSNVLLATGHYRNGILLAPATAQAICQLIAPNPA